MLSYALVTLLSVTTSPYKIMFVGDSLTSGYGVKQHEAYPSLIEKHFKKSGKEVEVINGGVMGDTSAGGKRRLKWMLKRSRPNLVVISLGGNDMLRGLPATRTKDNLSEMIQMARQSKVSVALLGIPAAPNLGEKYEQEFNAIFKSLSRDTKIPTLINYVDGVAGNPKLNTSDGLHPNPEGHRILADRIYEFLDPLIPATQVKSGEVKQGASKND